MHVVSEEVLHYVSYTTNNPLLGESNAKLSQGIRKKNYNLEHGNPPFGLIRLATIKYFPEQEQEQEQAWQLVPPEGQASGLRLVGPGPLRTLRCRQIWLQEISQFPFLLLSPSSSPCRRKSNLRLR